MIGLAALLLLVPTGLVADWQMDDPPGSTVMTEPGGLVGKIGARVDPTGHAYQFPGKGNLGPDDVQRGRLVRVPEDDRLDPGTGAYSVTIRFRTGIPDKHGANLIQKGQANQTGGYWKFVVHRGWPRCHFRDNDGMAGVGFNNGLEAQRVNDREWHTVTCQRLADGRSQVVLDHTWTRTSTNTTQRIDNDRPLVIGGKIDCAADDVGCDYIRARVRWVRIER